MNEYEWMQIAKGGQPNLFPAPFLRLLAAWELVQAWAREEFRPGLRDRDLLTQIANRVPLDRMAGRELDQFVDLSPYRHKWGRLIDQGRPAIDLTPESSALEILEAVYLVRCNLVHGGKGAATGNDLSKADAAAAYLLCLYRELRRSPGPTPA